MSKTKIKISRILFDENAWEDYQYWLSHDIKILKRINELIKDIMQNPFTGIGKPEPLKHALKGYWSRRITHEHRIIYKVAGDTLFIAQLRYHY